MGLTDIKNAAFANDLVPLTQAPEAESRLEGLLQILEESEVEEPSLQHILTVLYNQGPDESVVGGIMNTSHFAEIFSTPDVYKAVQDSFSSSPLRELTIGGLRQYYHDLSKEEFFQAENPLGISLTELRIRGLIDSRVHGPLLRGGFVTIADVLDFQVASPEGLLQLPNFGEEALNGFFNVLKQFGISREQYVFDPDKAREGRNPLEIYITELVDWGGLETGIGNALKRNGLKTVQDILDKHKTGDPTKLSGLVNLKGISEKSVGKILNALHELGIDLYPES